MDFEDSNSSEGETRVEMTDGDCYSQLSECVQDNLHTILVDTIKNYFMLKRGFFSPIDCSKTNQYRRDMRFLIKNWEHLHKMNQWFEQLMGARISMQDLPHKRLMNEMTSLFHQAMNGIFPEHFPVKKYKQNVSLLSMTSRMEEMLDYE